MIEDIRNGELAIAMQLPRDKWLAAAKDAISFGSSRLTANQEEWRRDLLRAILRSLFVNKTGGSMQTTPNMPRDLATQELTAEVRALIGEIQDEEEKMVEFWQAHYAQLDTEEP